MGAKQSAVGNLPLSQSPTLKNIQEAYMDGEDQRARELIRLSCENNSGGGPDGVSLIIFPLCYYVLLKNYIKTEGKLVHCAVHLLKDTHMLRFGSCYTQKNI